MTSLLQKSMQQANLYNQSRTLGPGVAGALAKFI